MTKFDQVMGHIGNRREIVCDHMFPGLALEFRAELNVVTTGFVQGLREAFKFRYRRNNNYTIEIGTTDKPGDIFDRAFAVCWTGMYDQFITGLTTDLQNSILDFGGKQGWYVIDKTQQE